MNSRRLATVMAIVLLHALVSCGVGLLVWLSGAGMRPLLAPERPGLWAVDVLAVAVFFPFLLLRVAGLDARLPEGLLGLAAHSFLWTSCVCLAWTLLRRLGRDARSLIEKPTPGSR